MPTAQNRNDQGNGPLQRKGTGGGRRVNGLGRCQGGTSRGRGRGGAWGRGPGNWAAAPAAVPTKDDLNLRARALEQELEAVRNELKTFSDE